MNDKILTISIAAYNVEKFLKTTLDSLLVDNSILEQIEVLVIDDGSKDSTKEIAQSYANMYPNSFFVISKENGGWGSTVNCGIKNAHGKYFRLLDGDDWVKTENLPDYISFLTKTDADIVVSPYIKIYEKNGTEEKIVRHSVVYNKICKLADLDKNKIEAIQHFELTIKTLLLKANHIEISEKAFYTDNEYVSLPLVYANTIVKFEKEIYCYRISRGSEGQSISLKGRLRNWESGEIVIRKLVQNYKLHEKNLPQTTKKMLFLTMLEMANWQFETYMLLDASKEIKQRLKEYDYWILRANPDLYGEMNKTMHMVFIMRKTKFSLYRVLHSFLIKRYTKYWN